MLRLTAAHTPVPESLRGQHFTIDLAIDFKPDDPPWVRQYGQRHGPSRL